METCANIAGKEVNRRAAFGYLGAIATVAIVVYSLLYITTPYFKGLIFISTLPTMVPFFEVRSETCIVNAFLGIKNMGQKYQKEQNEIFLKIQRKTSLWIIMKIMLISTFITLIFISF